jgi:hypothetical protein
LLLAAAVVETVQVLITAVVEQAVLERGQTFL